MPLTWKEFSVADAYLKIAAGAYDKHSSINKFGRNPDCDQAASATAVSVGRDIWDLGIAGAVAWVPPSAGRNLGNIDATADTDSTVTARVSADMSQTLMAIYQVPVAKAGYITHFAADNPSADAQDIGAGFDIMVVG